MMIYLIIALLFLLFLIFITATGGKRRQIERTLYIDNAEEFSLQESSDFSNLYVYDTFIDDNLPSSYQGNFIVRVLNSSDSSVVEFDTINEKGESLGSVILVNDSEFYRIPFTVKKRTDDLILRYKTTSTSISLFRIDIEILY